MIKSTTCDLCWKFEGANFLEINASKCCLCDQCFHNVKNKLLTPIEWYHLTLIYGIDYSYTDTEYYTENGRAKSKKFKREITDSESIPGVNAVADQLDKLMHYSMFPYADHNACIQALSKFTSEDIFECFNHLHHMKPTHHIYSGFCNICANVLKESAADWVRSQFNNIPYSHYEVPDALINAAAHCLQFDEAFLLAKQIASRDEMRHFKSPLVLDWIEDVIKPPYTKWGYLAAFSKLSWSRTQRWIEAGRPMSMVAICALEEMIRIDDQDCRLYEPESIEHMTNTLNS